MERLKLWRIIFLMVCVTLLTSCGFQLRNAERIPPQLRTLHLDTHNVKKSFSSRLRDTLKGLHVHLVATPHEAPYTLKILNYRYSHNYPAISDASLAVTYTFSVKASAEILNRQGRVLVGPKAFSSSRSITLNANQIYTADTDTTARSEMQRELITFMYYWLGSSKVRTALTRTPSTHAT